MINLEIEGIDELKRDFKRFGQKADVAIQKGTDRTALAIETLAKQRLKGMRWITGRLASSIHSEANKPTQPGMTRSGGTFNYRSGGEAYDGSLRVSLKNLESAVGTNVEYAPYIEFGTKAHEIKPWRAKALHLKNAAGEDVFAKRVFHPGIRPYSYLGYAALSEEKNLKKRIAEELNKLIKSG